MSSPSRTSSLVTQRPETPFSCTARLSAAASNHPQRRGRPVTEPYSLPRTRRCSPTSSPSSVGNGPAPTRVAYALATPRPYCSCPGPTPAPAAACPPTQFEEVTNGYV